MPKKSSSEERDPADTELAYVRTHLDELDGINRYQSVRIIELYNTTKSLRRWINIAYAMLAIIGVIVISIVAMLASQKYAPQ